MGNENVNIDKFLCLSHTFHLFLGAAQSSLLPFLTIYFRILGLSATQTGLIFGAKALVSFIAAPAWSACAKRFNKKKIILLFSLFMMMSSNLFLILVPPVDERIPISFCEGKRNFSFVFENGNFTDDQIIEDENPFIKQTDILGTTSTQSFQNGTLQQNLEEQLGNNGTKMSSTMSSTSTQNKQTPITKEKTTIVSTTTPSAPGYKSKTSTKNNQSPMSSSASTPSHSLFSSSTSSGYDYDYSDYGQNPEKQGSYTTKNKGSSTVESNKPPTDFSKKHLKKLGLSPEDMALLEKLGLGDLAEMSEDELEKAVRDYLKMESSKKVHKREILISKVRTQLYTIMERFELNEYHTFLFALLIIVFGELFSAPYQKLAEDCWFEYLDLLDFLEKFGGQRIWTTIGFVIVPTVAAAIVDHTDCMLSFEIHHFAVHFFIFAALMAFAFIVAFSYPVSQYKKTAKRSRLGKGLKVLCSDAHAVSMTITIIILGVANAVISNFLMWKIQDLSNEEMVMGVSIGVAACSQFLVELVGRSFVKKITPFGAVCLGLTFLAGRLVFYSFLWNPWLVLAGEAFHGISVTLIWISIQTYPDFRINPFIMDRSASSVVLALHIGVGYAAGSMISGVLYDKIGYSILFQGTAGLVGLWGLIFIILQKAVKRKEKVRYAKLLQDETGADSDESAVFEDDWLEVAMKRDQ